MEGQIFGEFREYTKWCGGVELFCPKIRRFLPERTKFCGASCDLEILCEKELCMLGKAETQDSSQARLRAYAQLRR